MSVMLLLCVEGSLQKPLVIVYLCHWSYIYVLGHMTKNISLRMIIDANKIYIFIYVGYIVYHESKTIMALNSTSCSESVTDRQTHS